MNLGYALRGSGAVALLELRCLRRAFRTWLLALLALAAGWAAFVFYHHAAQQYYSVDHYSGNIVPGRFLMAGYAACFFVPLLAGVVFLAFDHRQRDRAAGVIEALDARPVSNLAFFVGRLMALVAAMWLVCAVFVGLMQTAGIVADLWLGSRGLDSWLGPVEPWSLLAFLFVDAPSALVLWGALVLLLATVLRNRLVVALAGLALLALYAWLLLYAPLRLLPAVSIFSGFESFASDMLPRLLTFEVAAQRGAQLLLGIGLIALGAVCYARADHPKRASALVGGFACLAIGAIAIALLAQSALALQQQREDWRSVHVAHRNAQAPDLLSLSADVSIAPAEALRVDASLDLALPADSQLVLSLNPGMTVREVELDGQPAAHRHEDGLLHVEGAQPETNATLRIVAEGMPEQHFAYLDSIIDPLALGVADGHFRTLGTEAMVFSEHYAALLPGLKWLPTPGVNLEGTPDFHDLDLRLDVPADWLAVVPGQRESVESSSDRQRYRFRTKSAVPMVGVVAGRFERYAAKVGGVEMELLLHPGHRRNAEFFAPQAEYLLNVQLGMRLTGVAARGLRFPHERFSVVEAPGRLRGFGGGWRLDTALALPGIGLLREYGMPSMRMTMPPMHMVWFVMVADFSGGDPSVALWRNMTRYQLAAEGDYATVLDVVMEELTKSALEAYWPSFFSAHHFDAVGDGGLAEEVLDRVMGHATAVDHELKAMSDRVVGSPEYLTDALGDLRFEENPKRALDVLHFKASALASTLTFGWSHGSTIGLLNEMSRRHGGNTYTLEDLRSAGEAVGAPLDSLVGEWWASAELPGFVTSQPSAYRLADDEDGTPRYQLLVHVCNAEAAPGLVRLISGGDDVTQRRFSPATHLAPGACIEIGTVSAFPPTQGSLQTFLSRNGHGIAFPSLSTDAEREVDVAPLEGGQDTEWRPPANDDVVVDDLSPGFALDDVSARRGVRFAPRQATWNRQETHGSWGRYARTATWSEGGDGDRSATFTARLPHAGRWRLHFHLPGAEFVELEGSVNSSLRFERTVHQLGSYEMTLVQHSDEATPRDESTPIEFDGSIAEAGWNRLGDFDLHSPNVSLAVTDRTDGDVVVADAIRWQPLE